MPKVFVKRGTRAQVNAAKAASGLNAGELYLVTDDSQLSVGTAINSYFNLTEGLIFTGMDGGSATTTIFDLTLDLAEAYGQ